MIKTLTRHYHRIPRLGKLLLWMAFFLGVFVATFRFLYAQTIPFEDDLQTMFSWRFNSGYYSNTYFRFGGNDFVGIIFRQTGENLSTWELITINSWAQAISCTEKLRGIYYNNQRGRRIWPLDTWNLAILSGQGSWYETMTMDNGFFTNCTGVSWGYIPASNDVYGQIDHILGSQTFRMIAWVTYDFTGNAIISWTNFSGTLKINTWWVHTGFMFDTNGGIAELSMNVPWCQSFESSPSTPPIIISQSENMTFTCYGANVGGYILNIYLSGSSSASGTDQQWTNASSYMRFTWANLATGDYLATCTVMWPGGPGPQCWTNIPFHVWTWWTTPPSWTGCSPSFQGEINFVSYNGSTVINPSLWTYFTNKTGITLQVWVSEHAAFDISGDFSSSHLLGTFMGSWIFDYFSAYITLLYTTGWNNFSSTFTTGSCTYTDSAKRVYVDILPPTAPYIIAPANGANVCASTPLTVTRSGSTDSGAGLSYYRYEIYDNSWMTTGMILSWTVPYTVTSMSLNVSLLPLGTHYMRIVAVDNVGMTTNSTNTVSFTTSVQYCGGGTGVVIVTPTIRLRNVNLDTVYRSDPIYILGLTGPTLVTISRWMLFINSNTGGNWTTGMVTSADTLYIELVSSDEYDTTVTSELTILWLTGTFSVTTKDSDCILSTAEKLVIQDIYQNLKDEYDNDISKLSDFLNTFQSMVQDESDLSNSCTLEYLLQLIEDDLGIDWGIDTSDHITPNCKEYSIGYDPSEEAYYAPEMTNRYYFINRESLIRHLDYYNPGDCHINTYGNNYRTSEGSDTMTHIAPNGKIYHLIGQYGGFSATEFASPRYFDSLQGINMYIDLRNPPKEIRTHTVDTAFNPIVYAAPNGKEYKIFKTDRWFMSYKLMKVRYYSTLWELKSYIDKNNPSRR